MDEEGLRGDVDGVVFGGLFHQNRYKANFFNFIDGKGLEIEVKFVRFFIEASKIAKTD